MSAGRLAVAAFLMPWRAARVIREQREDIRVLVNVLGDVLADRSAREGRPPHLYLVK